MVETRGLTPAIDGDEALIEPARIVLGGRFGEEDPEISHQRLDCFTAAGGRVVDTAHSYAGGRSELAIGAWLRAHPGGIEIVDKIGHPSDDGAIDLSVEALVREAAESRERLGVDVIDVVMLHRDDPSRPVGELADSLLRLVAAGYARRVGVSNWSASRLAELAERLERAGQRPVVSYQFSLAAPSRPLWPGARHADGSVWRVVRQRRLPLLAWAGQARGFFAGASEPTAPGEPDPFDTAANRERRDRCRELARSWGCPPETVALAWTLRSRGVWPIVGARSAREVEVSMAATRLALDDRAYQWLSGRPE